MLGEGFALGFVQDGGVAQLVEHLLCKQRVVGSNPVASTIPGVTLEQWKLMNSGRNACVSARSL